MADWGTIVAQQQVTEFVPPDQTRQVMEITVRASPSGIVFSFRVPRGMYSAAQVAGGAQAFAVTMNADAAVPGVVSIDAASEIAPGQEIASYFDVEVSSTSGNSSIVIRMTADTLFLDTFAKRVGAAVAELDAIEAL